MKVTRIFKRNDGFYEPQYKTFWGNWKPVVENWGHGEPGGVGYHREDTAMDCLQSEYGDDQDYKGVWY